MTWFDSGARKVVAAVVVVSFLAGCTHVRPADPTAARVDLNDINSRLVDRMARVRLVDGTVLVAQHVRVSEDSVYFRPQLSTDPGVSDVERGDQALPRSEVRSIEVKRRGRGAADGALIGFGAGVLLGAVVGVGMYQSEDDPSLLDGVVAFLGASAVAAVGTGIGLAIGLGVGSTEVLELPARRMK